jgi:polyhydroxybutyrate depolymerase
MRVRDLPGFVWGIWLGLGLTVSAAERGGEIDATLSVGGRSRHYRLHVPPAPAQPAALVLVLHAHGGDARQAAHISGMSAKADAEGFFVAYPLGSGWRGINRGWNAGHCCGYAMSAQVDDVAFIRALIDHLLTTHPIDPGRVYVTGISNGAMMAHRLGCELSDRIAAIAPVAGTLGLAACVPSHPVSVLMIHGTADPYVPYAGGRGVAARDERVDRPISAVVSRWVAHNRCQSEPEIEERGAIRRERYGGGTGGAEVILYTIRDGGHAWPGGARGWRFGATPSRELSATDVLWDFFLRHRRQIR